MIAPRAGHAVLAATVFAGLMSLGVARATMPAASHVARDAVRASVDRPPNELGRIPILLYHEFGETEARWRRERGRFRADLELLYSRGYRPVGIGELLDRSIDLPRGLSPVVITLDDGGPSQFRYVERADGSLVIDST